jgi:hypothetical protein
VSKWNAERDNIVHITELRIRNYRNFTKAKFSFKPGLNTCAAN